MSRWFTDPQTDPSHPCIICGREIYGDYDICERCQEWMKEKEIAHGESFE